MGSFPSLNPSLETSIPGIYVAPSAVVGVVPVASGGTGATTAAAALAALGGVGAGSHTLKNGTNAGNISITATALPSPIDSTNLDVTVTVPLGMLALALLFFSATPDGTHTMTYGINVDGTPAALMARGGYNEVEPYSALAILVGDGASHVFSPQLFTGGGTVTVNNATGYFPQMLVLLLSAT